MDPTALKNKVESALENAAIEVIDLTGTHDHYRLHITSSTFEGMLPIKRHRLINDILKEELMSGDIHALQLDLYAPNEKQ